MFVYLHNPQCSKSRQGLAVLEASGKPFQVRQYLKEPLSLDELRILAKKLKLSPADFMRWNETEAATLSKTGSKMELLGAIASSPRLLERPILISSDAAVIGRPTEALDAFLNG